MKKLLSLFHLSNRILLLLALVLIFDSCTGQDQESQGSIPLKELRLDFPDKGFYDGFLDSKGNLWFSSRGNGLFKFDGRQFTNYTTENGLCDNNISCIAEDKKGNIWLGLPNGACVYDGTTFSSFEIPWSDTSSTWLDKVYPIINPNQVMSILEDKRGDLWFGTNGAGVYRYDGQEFTQHLNQIGQFYEDNLQHNIVLTIVEDLNQNLWFSSLSHAGVSIYDGNDFMHYVEELSDDFVRLVYCDSKGDIWIGTHGNHEGGLDRFDGERFQAFHKTNDGFNHNNVTGLFEDDEGTLWVGSGTTELSLFDGEHFKAFSGKDGQTYDKITFILGDDQGNVWFGNRFGLWVFDGAEVFEVTR